MAAQAAVLAQFAGTPLGRKAARDGAMEAVAGSYVRLHTPVHGLCFEVIWIQVCFALLYCLGMPRAFCDILVLVPHGIK